MKLLAAVLLAVLSLTVGPAAVVASAVPDPPGPAEPSGQLGATTKPVAPSPAVGIIATARDTASPEVVTRIEDIVGRDVAGQTELGKSTIAVRFSKPISAAALEEMTGRLAALPEISSVSPDLLVVSDALPNDTYFTRQINLYSSGGASQVYSIDAPTMWEATTGVKDVVVAFLDGGVTSHTDLTGQRVAGYDMISDSRFSGDGGGRDSNPADPGNYSDGTYCTRHDSTWHGTHVAGIIGALRNNAKGIAGIAPGAALQPVRVVGRCFTAMSDVIAGIRWASGGHVDGVADNKTPAKVVNASVSSTVSDFLCPTEYQEVIDEARSRGSLLVVSAGNQSASVLTRTPANCAGVLSVGAVAPDGSPTTYTNVGRTLGMVAPGGVDPKRQAGLGIWSTIDRGTRSPDGSTYGQMSGTSMAAPAVSAAAALVFSLGDFTADQVVQVLKAAAVKPPKIDGFYTCLSTDSAGNERNVCGAGILNLARIPAPTAPPAVAGATTLGGVLTMTPGTWNGTPTDVTHQWLRDGAPIAGEIGETHTVTLDDVGHALAVLSTARSAGYPDFTSESVARAVPKLSAKATLTLSRTTAYRRKTVVVAGSTVTASQGQVPTGTVSFYDGSKKLATATLVDGSTGNVSLPVFTSTGKRYIQARYSGSAIVAPASSAKVVVTVS